VRFWHIFSYFTGLESFSFNELPSPANAVIFLVVIGNICFQRREIARLLEEEKSLNRNTYGTCASVRVTQGKAE
jgi:hypothetical protein